MDPRIGRAPLLFSQTRGSQSARSWVCHAILFFGRKIMRLRVALVGVGAAAACVVASLPGSAEATHPRQAKVALLTADYEMNESGGAQVMTNSLGNGVDGTIVP